MIGIGTIWYTYNGLKMGKTKRAYSIEVPKDKNPINFYYEKKPLVNHKWYVQHRMFNTSLIIIEVD